MDEISSITSLYHVSFMYLYLSYPPAQEYIKSNINILFSSELHRFADYLYTIISAHAKP
jgi:hypothetical protein